MNHDYDIRQVRLFNPAGSQRSLAARMYDNPAYYSSFAGMTEAAIYAAIRRHDSRNKTRIPGTKRTYASV